MSRIIGTSLKILLWSVLLRIFQSVHIHTIVHFVPKFMNVPVVAEVGVVVSLLNVLAVEVTVVGVVVLSLMHTHGVRYVGQITVLFMRYMVTLASFSQQL